MDEIIEQTTHQSIQRQIAVKTSIHALLDGVFIAKDGWEPHIVRTKGMDIARVNILGVIVAKQVQNAILNYEHCLVDDGSGKITLRSFNDTTIFNRVDIGDIGLNIGRPREYGGEIYIVPEIVRLVENPAWLALRKMELASLESDRARIMNLQASAPEQAEQDRYSELHNYSQQPPHTEASGEPATSQTTTPSTPTLVPRIFGEADILHLLRNMDNGGGVSIESLAAKCESSKAEEIVQRLLQKGDIFEIRPGQIRILE